MSDPENFLSRWSRRKQEVAAGEAQREARAGKEGVETPLPPVEGERSAPPDTLRGSAPAGEPGFDVASLPSIDSITADTDIRAFLAPGVPSALTRAALRRVWVADPAIKNFVGLNDYDWDFHTPGAIPGFGPLDMPDDELKRQVMRIVGQLAEPEAGAAGEQPPLPTAESGGAAQAEPSIASEQLHQKLDVTSHSETDVHRSKEDAASHHGQAQAEAPAGAAKRPHGGALPT